MRGSAHRSLAFSGFMLSNSPGGNINFESCPFKLTSEYVEVLGGEDSDAFNLFRLLVIRGDPCWCRPPCWLS